MNRLLNRLSVTSKLIASSSILLLMMLISSAYALYLLTNVGNEVSSITNKNIPMISRLTQLNERQRQQTIYYERALNFGKLLEEEVSASSDFADNVEAFIASDKQMLLDIQSSKVFTAKLIEPAKDNLKNREKLVPIHKGLEVIEQQYQAYAKQAKSIFSKLEEGQILEVEGYTEEMQLVTDSIIEQLQLLVTEMQKFNRQVMLQSKQIETEAQFVLTALLLFSLFIGILLSYIIVRSIHKRLHNITQTLNTIALGDLSSEISVDGQDEIAKMQLSLTKMQQHLIAMISTIKESTLTLSDSTEKSTNVVQSTRANIQRQQSETDMVATAINQMAATAQEICSSISDTVSATNSANQQAATGSQLVSTTSQAINNLANEIVQASGIINELENESKTIDKVLDVIKGIAEQTNLLALNAAIEAARAGEQGRGFAVVADEVRTLAGRTQQSTQEINQMIANLQSESRRAVRAIERSCEQAQVAVKQANRAGDSISSIAVAVAKIDQMSSQIASAAEEQNRVSDEISRNITSINDIANCTVCSSQEIALANENLGEMAARLQTMVGDFKIA